MKPLVRTSVVALAATAALALGSPAMAGQDAGENGQPRLGTIMNSNAGLVACVDGLSPLPRCFLAYVLAPGEPEAGKVRVLGQGGDYNGNSIVEVVTTDASALQASGKEIHLTATFTQLGVLDLTLHSDEPGRPVGGGEGCTESRVGFHLGSPTAAIFQATSVKGSVHLFGQDYEVQNHSADGGLPACSTFFTGPTSGGFAVLPPSNGGLR